MNKAGPIIVIEDDEDDQQLIEEIFKRLAYINEIVFFTDGYEALEYLTKSDIKSFLILSDINMPKIDGIEATKQIKAAQPMISIIGLSVIEDKHVIEAMKAAGAETVLLKDDIHELHEAIRPWSLR